MTPEEIILIAALTSVVKKVGPENTVVLLAGFIIKICAAAKTEGCTVRFPFGETVTIDINLNPDEISH